MFVLVTEGGCSRAFSRFCRLRCRAGARRGVRLDSPPAIEIEVRLCRQVLRTPSHSDC